MNAIELTGAGLPQLLTIEQAADRLAFDKRTLYREIAAGRFPRPIKIRRMSRVRVSDVADYIAALVSGRVPQGGSP
jgi:excisionase family DNA binding protein